jgi:hypothetical protein
MPTRNPDLEARWRERVEAWRSSGLTAAQFAAQNGFSTSALTSGSSKLRHRAAPRPSAPAFVAVARKDAAPVRELVVDVARARVRVTQGFAPALCTRSAVPRDRRRRAGLRRDRACGSALGLRSSRGLRAGAHRPRAVSIGALRVLRTQTRCGEDGVARPHGTLPISQASSPRNLRSTHHARPERAAHPARLVADRRSTSVATNAFRKRCSIRLRSDPPSPPTPPHTAAVSPPAPAAVSPLSRAPVHSRPSAAPAARPPPRTATSPSGPRAHRALARRSTSTRPNHQR